jgi:hypothetical protein
VTVVLVPTKKAEEEGETPKVVFSTDTPFLAKDDGHAVAKALGKVPDEFANADDRLEVWLNPFCKTGGIC